MTDKQQPTQPVASDQCPWCRSVKSHTGAKEWACESIFNDQSTLCKCIQLEVVKADLDRYRAALQKIVRTVNNGRSVATDLSGLFVSAKRVYELAQEALEPEEE